MPASAPWPRAILHVDMDAFFASVEELDNPSLRGRPVVVGGSPEGRGVVAAASYAARRYGIHSAMAMARAVQLCPGLVRIEPRGARYAELSEQIHEIFYRYTPLVESLSIDEAFLDVTGSQRLFGPAPELARALKEAVRAETGLTASVGLAPVKFVAKIASDLEKPDGFVVIPAPEVERRLGGLPVGKLWGVGPKFEAELRRLGVATVSDLRAWSLEGLTGRFGETGRHLYELARGIDPRPVETEGETKSVSHETTFAADISDVGELESTLRLLADKVARRLRRAGLCGRVAALKLRYGDFSTITRQTTLSEPCALGTVLAEEAIRLLREKTDAGLRPVRLIGVGMASLSPEEGERQADLFAHEGRKRIEAVERVTDRIRDRHGAGAIRRGVHLPPPPAKGVKP